MVEKNKKRSNDLDYHMKSWYDISELFVSSFTRVSSLCNNEGPVLEKTNQNFIFELIPNGMYREVFTGFELNLIHSLGTGDFIPEIGSLFLYEIEKLTDCCSEKVPSKVSKVDLLYIQNDINLIGKKLKK